MFVALVAYLEPSYNEEFPARVLSVHDSEDAARAACVAFLDALLDEREVDEDDRDTDLEWGPDEYGAGNTAFHEGLQRVFSVQEA